MLTRLLIVLFIVRLYQIVEYLINETKVEINSQNFQGLTALDILNKTKKNKEIRRLKWIKVH